MEPCARTQDRHRIGAHCGVMASNRLRTARRIQAAVVGLGIAGALGTAAAVGLGSAAAGTTSDDNTGFTQQNGQNGTGQINPTPRQEEGEGGDDDGGRVTAPQNNQPTQQAPSAPQPGSGSGGSSHASTSGS